MAERLLLHQVEEEALQFLRRFKPLTTFHPEGKDSKEPSGNIQRNPQENFNPYGNVVSEVSLFVFGDLHFHPEDRRNPDPSLHLPTTKTLNTVRRIFGGYEDWHNQTQPILHNQALEGWESSIEAVVTSDSALKGENIAVVNTGDIAEDSVARPALEEAILKTQAQMTLIGNHLKSTTESRVLNIQALGDHDVDRRPWEDGKRHHQIEWVYKALGLTTTPACYLQEIGLEGRKPDKAILILDTNLMEDVWISTVQQESEKLFNTVQAAIKVQEALIEKAKDYKELVIIGHKPALVLKTAAKLREFSEDQTIIAGHRHIAYNSDNRGSLRPGDIKASLRGIRFLVVGAPTIGAGGIVVKGKAVGYLLKINSGQPTGPAYEVIPNGFRKHD